VVPPWKKSFRPPCYYSRKSQIVLVSKTYFAPESFESKIILYAYWNILDRNNKKIFHQIHVVLMISEKYSTKSSRRPPKCWTTSDAISAFTSSPVAVAKISNIAKFLAWAFRLQFSSFSTNALRVSLKSTIVLPLHCSFR